MRKTSSRVARGITEKKKKKTTIFFELWNKNVIQQRGKRYAYRCYIMRTIRPLRGTSDTDLPISGNIKRSIST